MNRGKRKTPEILEDFCEFLYRAKGLTYAQIAEFTGINERTVNRIAKRRGWMGKRAEPQSLDDTLTVIDDSFKTAVVAVNEFLKNELIVGDDNLFQLVTAQKSMMETRQKTIENSAYHSMKSAVEALKDVYDWLKKTKSLSEDERKAGIILLNTYKADKAKAAEKVLEPFTR